MENIRQAIERAKGQPKPQNGAGIESAQPRARILGNAPANIDQRPDVTLDFKHLQSKRIVAYDGKDIRSRPFDILRTEVLRCMDLKGWKTLAITSPTPGCGKTLTAVNLALSISRQPEREVFLADLDLRKPQVATYLGLKCRDGLIGVVEERLDIDSAIVHARAGSSRLDVLPTVLSSNASDLIASAAMRTLLQDITGFGQSRITILDLPPLLMGHDAMSILPQVDCVLLVAAVGTSTISEIEECNKHLQATEVVRFVLNKAPELASTGRYTYY